MTKIFVGGGKDREEGEKKGFSEKKRGESRVSGVKK